MSQMHHRGVTMHGVVLLKHRVFLSVRQRAKHPDIHEESCSLLLACCAYSSSLLCARTKPAPGKAEKGRGRISSVSTCEKPASETMAARSCKRLPPA